MLFMNDKLSLIALVLFSLGLSQAAMGSGVVRAVSWEVEGDHSASLSHRGGCLDEVRMSFLGETFSLSAESESPSTCGMVVDDAQVSFGEVSVDLERGNVQRAFSLSFPVYAVEKIDSQVESSAIAWVRIDMLVTRGEASRCAVVMAWEPASEATPFDAQELIFQCKAGEVVGTFPK